MKKITKETVNKDIEIFKSKGFKEKLDKIYRRLPVTECSFCGVCCCDTPNISYPEFLYIFNYFNNEGNFTDEEKIRVYKKSVYRYIKGLISKEREVRECVFLYNNKCLIYPVAPLNCKRWGLQSKESYERDLKMDHNYNKKIDDYYKKHGINITEENTNFITPYCDKVNIIKNPYNVLERDIDNIFDKDLISMIKPFVDKNFNNFTITEYLTYIHFHLKLFEDRITVIKEYQTGNLDAINSYIESIDFSKFI